MINLMNEMIKAATPTASAEGYAFEHRETEHGLITLYALHVNTNATNCIQKRWKLNGKGISAKRLEAL